MAETTSIHTNKKSMGKNATNDLTSLTPYEAQYQINQLLFDKIKELSQEVETLRKEVKELSSLLEIK